MTGDVLDKFICHVCGEYFVVPSLARDHELKHGVK